jgi:hypothetical protein
MTSAMCAVRRAVAAAAAIGLVFASAGAVESQKGSSDSKKPRLNLKAQPPVGISPVRVVLTAELVGGANDSQDYYCPTIQWEWGDGTSSEVTTDCAPYEEGKTEIKRRFTVEHIFRRSGAYKVYFRMKHNDKDIAAVSTIVQVQPGGRDVP